MSQRVIEGDVMEVLRRLGSGTFHCAVTSPPYWALRDYKVPGQLGLEKTPAEYVVKMVAVFEEVRRVLRDDGSLWVNIGDSYNANTGSGFNASQYGDSYRPGGAKRRKEVAQNGIVKPPPRPAGLKPLDLCGIPWSLALAMQAPREEPCIVKRSEDRAWLAAMMDGEGCIGIRRFDSYKDGQQKQDQFVVYISMGNNDIELLERCVAITGVGNVRLKKAGGTVDNRGIRNRRSTFVWRPESNAAIDVIRAIYPFLIAKRKQACVAYTLDVLNKSGRAARGNGPVPRELQEKRALLKEVINRLNQREPVDVPSWVLEPLPKISPGWYLRSDCVWIKVSAMPESLQSWRWERCRVKTANGKYPRHAELGGSGVIPHGGDIRNSLNNAIWSDCPGCPKCEPNGGFVLRRGSWRPTRAHEYVFQFTKTDCYYGDAEPVKTSPAEATRMRDKYSRVLDDGGEYAVQHDHETICAGANLRSWWMLPPEAFKGEHYAAFPSALPEKAILSSTSAHGCCAGCGAPWARVVEATPETEAIRAAARNGQDWTARAWDNSDKMPNGRKSGDKEGSGYTSETKTIGWRPTCDCNRETVPCRVLDPFLGSGTTLLVCLRTGRDGTGIELSPKYAEMARKRLKEESPLFA